MNLDIVTATRNRKYTTELPQGIDTATKYTTELLQCIDTATKGRKYTTELLQDINTVTAKRENTTELFLRVCSRAPTVLSRRC